MTRTFFVGGNFKMNGSTESIKKIVDGLNAADLPANVDVVVAPPFPYVGLTKSLVSAKTVGVAGQNIYAKSAGAFTGETSPEMLKDLGADWVILGHSERRTLFGESSALVAEKTKFALESGLKVIFCIGETKEERESNKTFEVVSSQTQAAIDALTPEQWKDVVIAYEPVWAIGTGLTASPEDAQEVHAQLREYFAKKVNPEAAAAIRIIYGGSVNGASAPGLAGKPDIDGFLVGGASLKPEFIDIIKAGAN